MLAPCVTVWLEGEAESVKLGVAAAVTISVTEAV
jgi:hypothetical protein